MAVNLGEGNQRPNPLQPPPMGLPSVASLKVTTSSFVVGEDAGRRPCAYIFFEMASWAQNARQNQQRASQRGAPVSQVDNDPGCLDGLQVAISIEGPAVKVFEIGASECQSLAFDDQWIVVVKVALRENLAAKISSSVRSRTDYSPSLIDQFLRTLETDSKRSEPVFVRAVIRYRHSFFAEDTLLETSAICAVGSLTTTSPTSTLTNGTLQGSFIHALDPGIGHFIHVTSVLRPERQHRVDFPVRQAITMIEDFRHVFCNSIPRLTDTDLINLEAYYYVNSSPSAKQFRTSTLEKSRRRVKSVISRLSMRKKRNVR